MGKIKLKNKQGFTLIEVIVVSGVMTLLVLTLISVFLATVRQGSKAQLIQTIHQEGDFALGQMVRVIRQAETVDCAGDLITIKDNYGANISFGLVEEDGKMRLASDSASFLTGKTGAVNSLEFLCYPGRLGNQVVSIILELMAFSSESQAQEKFFQEFATSVSTRQY